MKTANEILKEAMGGDDVYAQFLHYHLHPDWLMRHTLVAIETAQSEAYEESKQSGCKWIDVNEQAIPDNGQFLASANGDIYLVWGDKKNPTLYDSSKRSKGFVLYKDIITHWMKLPNLPKL